MVRDDYVDARLLYYMLFIALLPTLLPALRWRSEEGQLGSWRLRLSGYTHHEEVTRTV